MKITKKLFFTLFGIVIFIELLNIGLARWSFEQGLREFVRGLERERLQNVSQQLIQEYVASGNTWNTFEHIELQAFLSANRLRNQSSVLPNQALSPPEPRDLALSHRPPPHRPPHHGPPRHQSHGGANAQERHFSGPATALFDHQGNLIAGKIIDEPQDHMRLPIMLDGEQIGELHSWPIVQTGPLLASEFSRQQLIASVTIGLLCLVVAGVIVWRVSLRILAPVQTIIQGVSRLSDGRYHVTFDNKKPDELGQLMADIEALSTTLDKNRTAKNRWFANISHELRTPLTVLHGEIEVVKAGIRPLDMAQVKSFDQEVNLLRRLVDDLYQLSLSDVGGLRYQFSALNLSECIVESVNAMQSLAMQKEILVRVDIAENIVLNADAQRIEQLILNLMSNALNYTDPGGQLVISLQPTVDKHLLMTFNDSAPGLSEDECHMIFDPLYRHDSSRKMRESGAGLGLTICKNIVEAHQGKITATPSTLGGVCVSVVLPLHTNTHTH